MYWHLSPGTTGISMTDVCSSSPGKHTTLLPSSSFPLVLSSDQIKPLLALTVASLYSTTPLALAKTASVL